MAIVQRVQDILLKPKETWPVIATEAGDVKSIYTNYLVILAAIPAVAGFIGMSIFGMSFLGATIRTPVMSGLVSMVVGYVLSLVMIYVLALIANALAPTFGGEKNLLNAVKLIGYGATAGMVGGIFSLLPMLSMLGILAGLYSIYLIYTGIPVLMKAPADKAIGYTAVLLVCGFVASLILGSVTAMFSGLGMGAGHMMGRSGSEGGNVSIKVPGTEITIDTGKLEEASKKMVAACKQLEAAQASGDQEAASKAMGAMLGAAMGNDGAKPFPPERLQTFVPDQLGGLPRTAIEARTDNAMGLSFSSVEAHYSKENQDIEVKVQDIGAVKVLAMGMAAWASSTVNKETQDEVERVFKKDGVSYKEQYRKDGSRAELSMMLANGLMIETTANGMGMDALRAAVNSLDLQGLGGLAREK
jgi:hypothetical protein